MANHLDELCDALGIHPLTETDHRQREHWRTQYGRYIPGSIFFKAPASLWDQAASFDGLGWDPIRTIVPCISHELKDAETALEVGFGTAFALLYYAMDHPRTHFVGIDYDSAAMQVAEERVKKLGLSNVELKNVRLEDMTGEFERVTMTHVFKEEMSPQHIYSLRDKGFSLVSRKPGSGLIILESPQYQERPKGFSHIESVEFSYFDHAEGYDITGWISFYDR